MPDEVREHLTRDQRPFLHPESLQILQLHDGAASLQFTHVLQGSGQITGHSRSLVLGSVTLYCVVFEVCVWIIVRLEDPNMAHCKISNRVSHLLIFYLLVFDIIHDVMCLNKMSRTSSRNIGPQQSKIQQYISFYTWGTFYPCVHQTHLECLLLKSNIFSYIWSDHRSQSEVPVVSDNWICWRLFLDDSIFFHSAAHFSGSHSSKEKIYFNTFSHSYIVGSLYYI